MLHYKMSNNSRFQPYYSQLEQELMTKYGEDFPPLDPSNPKHRETLENCKQLPIREDQKRFLIAWRQVVDKTGWTLEQEKDISNKLSSFGYGINADRQIIGTFCKKPIALLVCSIWFWKRQAEVEKILDEEDRQAIKDKIADIDSLSNSVSAPEARLVARTKLENELKDLEEKIKERCQKESQIDNRYVERRAEMEQRQLEQEAKAVKSHKPKITRHSVSDPIISATPPSRSKPSKGLVDPEQEKNKRLTKAMNIHNADLPAGQLKVNLNQFEKLMEYDRFLETMSSQPESQESSTLVIQYIILRYQYYRSLLTTYPEHTMKFKCPYYNIKIRFEPTGMDIINGICVEEYIHPSGNWKHSLREYLEGKFNRKNRQQVFDAMGISGVPPLPEMKRFVY